MNPGKFRNISLPLILSCLLGACGGGDVVQTAAPPVTSETPSTPLVAAGTWVVMGSSTAAGAGATAGNGWSDLVQKGFAARGVRIENIAKGGAVTYQGLPTATPAVPDRPAPDPAANIDQALARNPVVLLLAYPTNDTANGYTVDESVKNISTIRDAAVVKHIPVLVLSTQPRNLTAAQLAKLQEVDAKLAGVAGGCFVSVNTLLAGPDGLLAPAYNSGDGVHPNDAGHRVIADAITKVVNSGTCFRVQN